MADGDSRALSARAIASAAPRGRTTGLLVDAHAVAPPGTTVAPGLLLLGPSVTREPPTAAAAPEVPAFLFLKLPTAADRVC